MLWVMRHWCNSALEHDRQRGHLGSRHLDILGIPSHANIIAKKITAPPPAAVCTDAELDRVAAEAVRPRSKGKAKAKAKAQAASSGSRIANSNSA